MWPADRLRALNLTQWGHKEKSDYSELKRLKAKNNGRTGQEERRYRELQQKGADRPPTKTSGQLKLYTQSGAAPQSLTLQSKVYKYQGVNEAVYLKDEAMNLLQNTPLSVTLPLHDPERPNAPPVNHKYRVSSIVCHRGNSLKSGHYITLKFEGNDVIVCDDDIVLKLNDYLTYRGQPPCKDWREFCRREGLSGYLFGIEQD